MAGETSGRAAGSFTYAVSANTPQTSRISVTKVPPAGQEPPVSCPARAIRGLRCYGFSRRNQLKELPAAAGIAGDALRRRQLLSVQRISGGELRLDLSRQNRGAAERMNSVIPKRAQPGSGPSQMPQPRSNSAQS